jgi:hypothetical protein
VVTPPALLPGGEHGTLWHETLFKEAPQRDRQFARNRNDHDPSDTPALPCGSLHKPAGDRTFWLVFEPEPSRLDYGPAHLASPGSLPGSATDAESRSGRIGPISLEAKQTGERSARKSARCVRRGGDWKRGMVEMV